jgi:hypothetical protein
MSWRKHARRQGSQDAAPSRQEWDWDEVDTVNGEKILNHDGSDWGVRTLAMFVPSKGIGVVVFTSGENGKEVIRKVVEVLYRNKLYVATI